MKKHYYLLQLEMNHKNHIIFKIKESKKGFNEEKGYMVLEDTRRAGTLDDFDFLKHCFDEENVWDDFRNLIFIKIYTFFEVTTDEKDALLELAETMIEWKPSVNHRVDFYVSDEFSKLYDEYFEGEKNVISVYQWLINANSENIINLEEMKIDNLNYLSQINEMK